MAEIARVMEQEVREEIEDKRAEAKVGSAQTRLRWGLGEWIAALGVAFIVSGYFVWESQAARYYGEFYPPSLPPHCALLQLAVIFGLGVSIVVDAFDTRLDEMERLVSAKMVAKSDEGIEE